MIWTYKNNTLLEFIDNGNRLHSKIKFAFSFFTETVNFQNTTVHLIHRLCCRVVVICNQSVVVV